MRLSRVYVAESLTVGSSIALNTAASHYIRNVLRLKHGAAIALFNGKNHIDYQCLLEFSGKQTIAMVQSEIESNTESSLDSEIILGLSRSDHLDLAIQKCTELGVSRLSIFNAKYSQIPLKPAQQEKRFAHWRAIAIKASEQCGRHLPPTVDFHACLLDLLKSDYQRQNLFLLDFDGVSLQKYRQAIENYRQVSIMVGPEGGLSDDEITLAKNRGFTGIRLGPRVLRTETAAMTSLSIVQSAWGDLN